MRALERGRRRSSYTRQSRCSRRSHATERHGGFLLQHALQGWCPPVPLLRRLGVRTRSEIDCERYALKAVRGDFKLDGSGDGQGTDVAKVMAAVRR